MIENEIDINIEAELLLVFVLGVMLYLIFFSIPV